MSPKTKETRLNDFIIKGLLVGYAYTVILSASSIAVCEIKNKDNCSSAWSQGYSIAAGLVSTFLAYLIPPSERMQSLSRTKPSTHGPDAES